MEVIGSRVYIKGHQSQYHPSHFRQSSQTDRGLEFIPQESETGRLISALLHMVAAEILDIGLKTKIKASSHGHNMAESKL